MMSLIDSQHWKISTGRHFQNGCHNTAQIQHCPISAPFHMWVDYDVANWFLTSKNFYRSPFSKWKSYLWNRTMLNFCGIVAAILKMETGRNFSMSGINSGRWNRTMLNLCSIVVAILKMATGRNFSMSGINSGHDDIEKFLPVSIFNMAATIPQKFNIVLFQR
jgi:hypothetical protein